MSNGPLEKVLSDDVKSGLKITVIDEAAEFYARVSWIHWDSGFRDSGLEIQDRIVAINGTPLALPADPRERRNARDLIIGQLSESKTFAALGLKDGSPLTLTVLRRNVPGRGWKKLDITGSVRCERYYYTTDEKAAIAPGGPERVGGEFIVKLLLGSETVLDNAGARRIDSAGLALRAAHRRFASASYHRASDARDVRCNSL